MSFILEWERGVNPEHHVLFNWLFIIIGNRSSFNKYDRNKDGFISFHEFWGMFITVEVEISKQTAKHHVAVIDVNKDGKISFQEYDNALKGKLR